MKRLILAPALMIVLALAAKPADATIVWDYSPASTGANESIGWVNQLNLQAFAEHVTFAVDTTLGGMDIYGGVGAGVVVGDSATIRLWADDGGQPGALLMSFAENISVIDSEGAVSGNDQRLHVDFSLPLVLNASVTYWIGMTGTTKDFSQTGLSGANAPDNSSMAQFNGGDTFSYFTSPDVGDQAFRLHGFSAVPEPSGLALLIPVAASALATFRVRQRRAASH